MGEVFPDEESDIASNIANDSRVKESSEFGIPRNMHQTRDGQLRTELPRPNRNPCSLFVAAAVSDQFTRMLHIQPVDHLLDAFEVAGRAGGLRLGRHGAGPQWRRQGGPPHFGAVWRIAEAARVRTWSDRFEGAAQRRAAHAAPRSARGQRVGREAMPALQVAVDGRRGRQVVVVGVGVRQVLVVAEQRRVLGGERQLSVEQEAGVHGGGRMSAREQIQRGSERVVAARPWVDAGRVEVGQQMGRRVDGRAYADVGRRVLATGAGGPRCSVFG